MEGKMAAGAFGRARNVTMGEAVPLSLDRDSSKHQDTQKLAVIHRQEFLPTTRHLCFLPSYTGSKRRSDRGANDFLTERDRAENYVVLLGLGPAAFLCSYKSLKTISPFSRVPFAHFVHLSVAVFAEFPHQVSHF